MDGQEKFNAPVDLKAVLLAAKVLSELSVYGPQDRLSNILLECYALGLLTTEDDPTPDGAEIIRRAS